MHRTARPLDDVVRRVAARDRSAFAELYRATSAKLYGIIFRILRRKDLADEVLQEVYVKVWERAGDFDPRVASPITWMATIARNRALDEVRRKTAQSIEDTPEAMDVADGGDLALDTLLKSEDGRRLGECLNRLEPERREMVVLAYCQGASREELAARYGAPVSTIKTWLRRALQQLKACLSS